MKYLGSVLVVLLYIGYILAEDTVPMRERERERRRGGGKRANG